MDASYREQPPPPPPLLSKLDNTTAFVFHPGVLGAVATVTLLVLVNTRWNPRTSLKLLIQGYSQCSSPGDKSSRLNGTSDGDDGGPSSGPSSQTPLGASSLGDKKKRSKERRKRGKDPTKEVVGQQRRALRQRPPTVPSHDSGRQYITVPATFFPGDPSSSGPSPTTSVFPGSVSASEATEDVLDNSQSDAEGTLLDVNATPMSKPRHRKTNLASLPLETVSLPLPPSSLTHTILAALSNAPSFASDHARSIPGTSHGNGNTFNALNDAPTPVRSTSPTFSNVTSIISGSTDPSSSTFSPRTPPSVFPTSHSVPSKALDRFDMPSLRIGGEPSIWENEEGDIEINDDVKFDDNSTPSGPSAVTQPNSITASVSAPVAWDSSLDWNPRQPDNHTRRSPLRSPRPEPTDGMLSFGSESVSDSSTTEPKESPPPRSHTEVLFPSLHDPPPQPTSDDGFIVNEDDIESLRSAWHLSRSSEEKWKAECSRLSQEYEKAKWAWSEDVRKLHVKESESQHLQYQLFRLMSMNGMAGTPQAVALPSPLLSSFPFYPNGQPTPNRQFSNGKMQTSSPHSMSNITLPPPQPPLLSPFTGMMNLTGGPFTPIVGPPPSLSTNGGPMPPLARPPSGNGGRRRASRSHPSSRNPSSSRAPSPYGNAPLPYGNNNITLGGNVGSQRVASSSSFGVNSYPQQQQQQPRRRPSSTSSTSSSKRPQTLSVTPLIPTFPSLLVHSPSISGGSGGGSVGHSPGGSPSSSRMGNRARVSGESSESTSDLDERTELEAPSVDEDAEYEDRRGEALEIEDEDEEDGEGDADDDGIPLALASAIFKSQSRRNSRARSRSSTSSRGIPSLGSSSGGAGGLMNPHVQVPLIGVSPSSQWGGMSVSSISASSAGEGEGQWSVIEESDAEVGKRHEDTEIRMEL